MSTGINGLNSHIKDCEACALGKGHCQPSHRTSTKATKPFEQVHADLGGGGSTLAISVGQNKYYILYTDDCTRFRWLDVLRTKDQAMESFRKFNSMVKNQFSTRIQRYQTDQGGEFKSTEMDEFLAKEGIIWEPTVPYAHKQNGTAERGNQTIQEKARTSLIDAGLPRTLWAEALNTAVYLANRSPTSQLKTTPYEALHGKAPDLSNL